ncbi:uncharacterized protein V1516DRAFT_683993 [Lipomyces oligophaga]|uniref:uncharacterized protein n=1 Tax=Lipomyces oligophaga TaxID=45792 RepID=UPI0034CD7127
MPSVSAHLAGTAASCSSSTTASSSAGSSASSNNLSHPPAQRHAPARPALRPILPKPPAIAPAPPQAVKLTGNAHQTPGFASVSSLTATSLSPLGSRVLGSVASSIFAGSTTISLPPRPSASRSKAKKRASPDRLVSASSPGLQPALASTSLTLNSADQSSSASQAAALKKRRRAKHLRIFWDFSAAVRSCAGYPFCQEIWLITFLKLFSNTPIPSVYYYSAPNCIADSCNF